MSSILSEESKGQLGPDLQDPLTSQSHGQFDYGKLKHSCTQNQEEGGGVLPYAELPTPRVFSRARSAFRQCSAMQEEVIINKFQSFQTE
jgi:hypothetical protein